MKPIDLTVVITHELGHSFGLGHSKHKGDMMFPLFDNTLVITDDDIKRFNDVASNGVVLSTSL